MRSPFSEFGKLVQSGLERTGLSGAVREKTAITLWKDIVGEKTASVTRVDRITQGVMFVTCRDSMWAQELHYLRPAIIAKINEKLGAQVVKEIRLSGRGFSKADMPAAQPAKQEEKPLPELAKDEIAAINAAARETIENEDLAKKVAKALEASRKLRKKFE